MAGGLPERLPKTIRDLGTSYRDGTALPSAMVKECLGRIRALNGQLDCFITVLADSALKQAEASDRRFRSGAQLGPLDGVPIAVKDLIFIEGVRCTAGSKILATNVASYDAEVIVRLKRAGAVLVGTTNLHEFAAGTTNVNPHFGSVRNPWDEGRISGGSSGGSAVAVAAGMVPGALGTDTGGSVRIPAGLCGVLGLKPTYGRVSRLGVVPLSPSLDVVGVLTRTAWDAAALLQVMAGHGREDVTTAESEPSDYLGALSAPFSPPRVGVIRGYSRDAIDPAVEENFSGFVSRLAEMGCAVSEVTPDWVAEAADRWVPVRRAEATAFHLRWLQASPQLYGDDVRKLLELGKEVLALDYVGAINARPALIERFSSTLRGFDVLAIPTTAVPATKLDQASVKIKGKEVPVYSALNRLTLPFNYIGCPALSVPSGMVSGLPLGVQLVGGLFDEAGLLSLAQAYEMKYGPYPAPLVQAPASG